MREPFSDESIAVKAGSKKGAAKGGAKAVGIIKGGKKARRSSAQAEAQGKAVRPHLPRVPGGKALARLHFFEQQREIEETDIKRKKPDKPSAKFAGAAVSSARPSTRSSGA